MNQHKLLRVLILTDVFSMVGAVIAAVVFEGTLPEPLRAYVSTEELHPFLSIVGLVLVVLFVAGWVGLWRNASWAAVVYAIAWAGCAVAVPFAGPFVGTAIEEFFDFVGTGASGGILVLVVLGMDQRRSSGRAVQADAGAVSEGSDGVGGSNHSDEQVGAHIKSSRVHRIVSWLYGFIALLLLGLPYSVWADGERGVREMAIAFTIPSFFFALVLLHHVVSRGARERRRWARIGSILLACLLLPGVPLGTVVGVYLLRNSSWEPRSAVAPASPLSVP